MGSVKLPHNNVFGTNSGGLGKTKFNTNTHLHVKYFGRESRGSVFYLFEFPV